MNLEQYENTLFPLTSFRTLFAGDTCVGITQKLSNVYEYYVLTNALHSPTISYADNNDIILGGTVLDDVTEPLRMSGDVVYSLQVPRQINVIDAIMVDSDGIYVRALGPWIIIQTDNSESVDINDAITTVFHSPVGTEIVEKLRSLYMVTRRMGMYDYYDQQLEELPTHLFKVGDLGMYPSITDFLAVQYSLMSPDIRNNYYMGIEWALKKSPEDLYRQLAIIEELRTKFGNLIIENRIIPSRIQRCINLFYKNASNNFDI